MTKLLQTLWATFLFTFPFSIRFLVYAQNSYRFGQFNPWVAGFLYLPEILLMIVWGIYFFEKVRSEKKEVKSKSLATYHLPLITLFILNAYLITLFKADSMLAAYWLLRIFEVGMVIQLIKAEILPIKKMIQWLLYGALFQVALSFFQWNLNGSMGLQWLGESVFNANMKGAAKIDLTDGTQHIRSYGTFLHPNIMAAYFITLYFLAWDHLSKKGRWKYYLLFSLGLFFAQSHAAFIAGSLGLLLFALHDRLQKKVGFIILGGVFLVNIAFFFNPYLIQKNEDLSVTERQQQIEISRHMAKDQPIGVGVRNFTLEMEKYTNGGPDRGPNWIKLMPWQFQPVHNVYYLATNETGLQGLLMLISLIGFFIYFNGISVPLIALLILASFDHLLWTSWTGLVLIALTIGLTTDEKRLSD